MLNIHRFSRFIRVLPKVSLRPLKPLASSRAWFSKQKGPSEEEISQIKNEAKEFYGRHIEDIIELEKY
jgi:hypothetical protein